MGKFEGILLVIGLTTAVAFFGIRIGMWLTVERVTWFWTSVENKIDATRNYLENKTKYYEDKSRDVEVNFPWAVKISYRVHSAILNLWRFLFK